jgi:hypothetical protein
MKPITFRRLHRSIAAAVISVLVTMMIVVNPARPAKLMRHPVQAPPTGAEGLVARSMTFAMSDGERNIHPHFAKTPDALNMHPFDEQHYSVPHVTEVRIIPARQANTNRETTLDKTEARVLKTRTPQHVTETFHRQTVERTIVPVLAEESCTSCHTQAIGEPIAVASVRLATAGLPATIRAGQKVENGVAFLSLLLVLFVLMLVNRKGIAANIYHGIMRLVWRIRKRSTETAPRMSIEELGELSIRLKGGPLVERHLIADGISAFRKSVSNTLKRSWKKMRLRRVRMMRFLHPSRRRKQLQRIRRTSQPMLPKRRV